MSLAVPWLLGPLVACRAPVATPPAGGAPTPTIAGPTLVDGGVSWSVPSRAATRIEAWIYADPFDAEPALVVPLTRGSGPFAERFTGSAADETLDAAGLDDAVYYGLRAWGPNWPWDPDWIPGSTLGFRSDVDDAGNRFNPNKLLFDPYARELSHDPDGDGPVGDWGAATTGDRRAEDTGPVAPKSVFVRRPPLDPPRPGPGRAPEDEVVYEVHVRGFTRLDPAVPEPLRGTYAGAAMRAADLRDLGVTAIELLPVHETNNAANDEHEGADGDNYWGYSSLSFFAVDRRYAADTSPGGPEAEFREMVDAFHAEGISVILDVVFNHTAEGGTWGDPDVAPLLSFRGLDNAAFYELDGPGGYRSDNGVGPNWNAVDPLARQLVLDALRYARYELGVDGFRFDLAPILGNGCGEGCFTWAGDDPAGVLVRAPIEVDARFIAEPWGATGEAYRGGQLPAGWAEWNDGFRDAVRADLNLLGVQDVTLRAILDAVNGSPGRFADDGRLPWSSVNYVVSHDGFTLRDQFSCDAPDNDQPWPYGPSSGGSTNNLSWDQGGDVVQQRRVARTALALSLVSAGIPMFTGGDELRRSQRCNNNPYNLDSVATWIDWGALGADPEAVSFRAFTRSMLAFRAAHAALRPARWRPDGAVRVYTNDGAPADADLDDPDQHALALYFDGALGGDDAAALLVLYNGWSDGVTFTLPPAPSGERWRLFADTHEWMESDDNTAELGAEPPLPDDTYLLGERSLAVLVDPEAR